MNETPKINTPEYAKMITEKFIDPETESLTEQLYMNGNQAWKEIAKFNQNKRGKVMEDIASFMLKSNNIKHKTQVRCPQNDCDCCKGVTRYDIDFQLKNKVNIELKTSLYSVVYKQNPDLAFKKMKICSQSPYSYFWFMAFSYDSHEIKSWLVPYKDLHMFATTQERINNSHGRANKYKGLRVSGRHENRMSAELTWKNETPDWLVPYEGLENNLAYLSRLYGQNGQIGRACA